MDKPVCEVPFCATFGCQGAPHCTGNRATPSSDDVERVAACCEPGGACYEAGLADVQHKVEPLVARVADALRDHISAEPQVREDIARAAIAALQPAAPVETGIDDDALVERVVSILRKHEGSPHLGDTAEEIIETLSAPQTDDRLREALREAEQFLDKANALALGEYTGCQRVLAERLAEVRDTARAALASGGQHGG